MKTCSSFQSLMENGTWHLVDPPFGCKPLKCKWIGKFKPGYEGVKARYKGRLVAVGCAQQPGTYDQVFSPVPHHKSVKAVYAEIAASDMEVAQFDIKTAFLYAKVDKLIYMEQPEGFVVKGLEKILCQLDKSIYGLKQAPFLFFRENDRVMKGFELESAEGDRCIYIRRRKNEITFVILHVDDSFALAKIFVEIAKLRRISATALPSAISMSLLRWPQHSSWSGTQKNFSVTVTCNWKTLQTLWNGYPTSKNCPCQSDYSSVTQCSKALGRKDYLSSSVSGSCWRSFVHQPDDTSWHQLCCWPSY